MMYVHYEQAVEAMTKGLSRFMCSENTKHFAEIFASNALDGIYSHGMNRYPRYISDMESGICDPGRRWRKPSSFCTACRRWRGAGAFMPPARALTERARKTAKTAFPSPRRRGRGFCRPKKRMCKKLHLNSDENRRYD